MAMVGTRGDVQPYVALACALVSAGHEVTVASNRDAAGLVAASGARFAPIGLDVHEMLSSPEGQRLLANGKTRQFLDFANRSLAGHSGSAGQAVLAAAEGADAFVAGLGIDDYAVAAGQALGVPVMLGYLAPWLPTAEHPQIMVYRARRLPGRLGPRASMLTHRVTEVAYWRGRRKPVNAYRRSLGLPAARCSIVTGAARLGTPALLAYSPAVHPRPRDWHPGSVTTGYWHLPAQARKRLGEGQPPLGLDDWLGAGEPPVFVGFGSMPILDPAPLIDAVTGAARRAKVRVLLGAGWTELAPAGVTLPEYVHAVGDVDHDWLFPRCQAVIHHGGTGTTGAGLTAGRPTWVYSLFFDQAFWGDRVRRLGVGGHARFRHLRADALAGVIHRLTRPDVRRRAGALGARLRREDGVATAVRTITQVAEAAAGQGPGARCGG
jgi:sterol 3beta-glucosyltransferase